MASGARPNVVRALHSSGEPRTEPQTVRCPLCGSFFDFRTDGINGYGRVLEVCPNRACFYNRPHRPTHDTPLPPSVHKVRSRLVEVIDE